MWHIATCQLICCYSPQLFPCCYLQLIIALGVTVVLGKRLTNLRKSKDLTQEQFSALMNVSRATYAQYEIGRRQPDYEILQQIADFYNVTTDYLLGRTENPRPYIYTNTENKNDVSSIIKSPSATYNSGFIPQKTQSIPVLGKIRAGLPVLAEDNWEDQISVPDYLNADFALRIVGDSMVWAGINEGDLALMEQISAASHGQIVAAGVEDIEWQATLKFFVQENGGFKLRAANPAYADIVFTPQHRIIGRLIRIIKESPSLYDYKNMVVSKEVLDSDWQDAIMKACETGLDGKNIQDIIEMFANVVKNVK